MKNEYIGKKVLVYGKGISGLGAKMRLTSIGARVDLCDDNDFKLYSENYYDLIVVSPSIKLNHEIFRFAKNNNIELIGEIELGYRLTDKPIIAVTGTNGKTTVTDMITTVLSSEYYSCACGNIGKSFANETELPYEYFIVEVSSFQLETVEKFAPKIAILTNLAPDHIDRHGTYSDYVAQKSKICSNMTENDYFIVSADDVAIEDLKQFSCDCRMIYVSIREKVKGAYVIDDNIYWYDEFICKTDRISVPFKHNVKNALFAVAVAKILGIDILKIKQSLGKLRLRGHRLVQVDEINGVTFYNDSKATNISATITAMDSIEQPFCLILGGSYKGYGFDELFNYRCNNLVKVFATGETAPLIEESGEKFGISVTTCSDLRNATVLAYKSGCKCVLFSPACASFDKYTSYAQRGEDFVRIVKELRNETR